MSHRSSRRVLVSVTTNSNMDKPEILVGSVVAQDRDRLLDQIDRISEILFGLNVAVTIVD